MSAEGTAFEKRIDIVVIVSVPATDEIGKLTIVSAHRKMPARS